MIQQQQANINARIAQMSDVNGMRYVVPNQYPSVQQAIRPAARPGSAAGRGRIGAAGEGHRRRL